MRSLDRCGVFGWRGCRWQAVQLTVLVASSTAPATAELEPAAVIFDVAAVGAATEVQWLQLPDEEIPAGSHLVVRTVQGFEVASTPIAANPSDAVLQGPFVIPIADAMPEKSAGSSSMQRQVAIEDVNGGLLSPVYDYALLPVAAGNGCGHKVIDGAKPGDVALISDELAVLLDNLSYCDLEGALQALLPHHALACEIESLLAHLALVNTPVSSDAACSPTACSYFWHAIVRRSPAPDDFNAQLPQRLPGVPGFVEVWKIENGGFHYGEIQAVGTLEEPGVTFTLPASWAHDGRVELDLALRRRRGSVTCTCTAAAAFSVEHEAEVFAGGIRPSAEGEAGALAKHQAVFTVNGLTVLDAEIETIAYSAGEPHHETHNSITESRAAGFQAPSFAARLDLHGETNALAYDSAWSYGAFINPYYQIGAEATATCASPEAVSLEVSSDYLAIVDSTLLRRWPRLD